MIYWMILVLFSAPVYYAITRIAALKKCPLDEELRSAILFRTTQNKKRDEIIISHLGVCEKCREKVRQFNNE